MSAQRADHFKTAKAHKKSPQNAGSPAIRSAQAIQIHTSSALSRRKGSVTASGQVFRLRGRPEKNAFPANRPVAGRTSVPAFFSRPLRQRGLRPNCTGFPLRARCATLHTARPRAVLQNTGTAFCKQYYYTTSLISCKHTQSVFLRAGRFLRTVVLWTREDMPTVLWAFPFRDFLISCASGFLRSAHA